MSHSGLTKHQRTANELKSLHKPSIGFYKFLENLLSKVNVDFATDELGMRSLDDFQNDIVSDVFHKSNYSILLSRH